MNEKGCLVRGCLFFSFVLFVFAAFFGWGVYSTYKELYALTSDVPVTVPASVGYNADDVKRRYETFASALEAHQPATLRLSADDLNALVATNPDFAELKQRVYFSIEGNKLSAQVSVKLDAVNALRGRWFNGLVTFEPKMERGRLSVIPTSIKAGKLETPTGVLKALQAFSWTDLFVTDPQALSAMTAIQSIRVESDAVVIDAK